MLCFQNSAMILTARTHARMHSRVTMHHKGVAAKSAGEVFH